MTNRVHFISLIKKNTNIKILLFVETKHVSLFLALKKKAAISLKGASHEIDFGQICYQKKDLEKLEVRGWFIKSTGPRA